MFIKNLELKNFRNYKDEKFTFKPGINVLVGANAQGKTNSAEAIFLLCTGYSPKASKDTQLILHGEEKAKVIGTCETKYGDVSVEIEISRANKKAIKINGVQILRIGELFGNINSVFFNPGELKLVQESPEDRRRFLNIALSQMNKNYFYALQRYNKILEQRNKLLKNENYSVVRETLPIWDEQFIKNAVKIIVARNEFLKMLTPHAQAVHSKLTDGKETLKISSESGYYGSEEEISIALEEDLLSSRDKDVRLGFTNIGPHRDDMKILLNGQDIRVYGSQGQQRTVALAIKLAEAEIFNERFGEYPILILDDVLSELDKKRQRRLMASLDEMQTILTCTNFDKSILGGRSFNKISVVNGKIKS